LIEDLVANKVKVQDKDWRLTFAGAPHVRAGRWMAVAVVAFLFFWASSSLSRTFPMLIVSTAKVDDGDRAMHGSLLFIGDKSASVETDAQIAPTPLTRKLLWSDLKVFSIQRSALVDWCLSGHSKSRSGLDQERGHRN
jgi:hypothetical protein